MQVKPALNYKVLNKDTLNFKANSKQKSRYDEMNNTQKAGMSIALLAFPIQLLCAFWSNKIQHKLKFTKEMSAEKKILLEKKIETLQLKVGLPISILAFIGCCTSFYPSILKFFRRDRNKMGKDHIALFNEAINKPQKCQKRS